MGEDQLKTVAKLTAVFCVLALAVCLWRAATKPVTIVGTAQAEEEKPVTRKVQVEETYDAGLLTLVPVSAANGDDMQIPLPAGIRSEDVQTRNLYLSGQFWVILQTSRSSYGKDLEVPVNADKVREGVIVRTDRNTVSLRFGLAGLYEPTISLADGMLHVSLEEPAEVYEHVVLVDPIPPADMAVAENGAENSSAADAEADGEDAALRVAEAFAALYEGDGRTKVYLTRQGSAWDEETALGMLQETGADLFIRLALGETADTTEIPGSTDNGKLRVFYNEKWFLRRYTNAEFARDLAAGVAGSAGVAIDGLNPVGRQDPLLAVCGCAGARLALPAADADAADPETAAAQIAEGMRRAVSTAYAAMEGL